MKLRLHIELPFYDMKLMLNPARVLLILSRFARQLGQTLLSDTPNEKAAASEPWMATFAMQMRAVLGQRIPRNSVSAKTATKENYMDTLFRKQKKARSHPAIGLFEHSLLLGFILRLQYLLQRSGRNRRTFPARFVPPMTESAMDLDWLGCVRSYQTFQ